MHWTHPAMKRTTGTRLTKAFKLARRQHRSLRVLVEDQASVGASEAEGVGHHAMHLALVPLGEDLHALGLVHQVLDVGGLREKLLVHHKQRVDGLVHAGGAQGMAGERLGGADEGHVAELCEDALHGTQLLHIANRSGGSVRVDIVDLLLAAELFGHGQRQLHAALAAEAGRGDDVIAVRIGRVAHQLSVDPRTAGLGVLKLLEDDHAAAAGDDEAITILVEGPGGLLGGVVALRRQCAHAVEHRGELPALVLPCTGHGHVDLAELDLLHAHTDAMRARGAGGGDGEGGALQLECRREHGRDRGAHGPGHSVGTHLVFPALPLLLHRGDGLRDVRDGGAALAQDARAAGVLPVLRIRQAGVLDGVVQGDVGILRVLAHEAQGLAVDLFLDLRLGQLRGAANLATDVVLQVLLREGDTRLCLIQRVGDLLQGVAQA
mmetsp:Transcript_111172/g.354165  ORF Transcript_111172/g.354165 Transcript_111172/m.354165 type:complete len:435 (-) Transcript_111172:475-1779(-)